MWELVCYHTYKWCGLATDLSCYGSDGAVTGASFLQDGAAVGSGALRFGPGDGVHIETGPAFRPLVGVRVECAFRVTTSGHPKTLIEADKAFKIFVGNGYLFAAFRKPSIYGGMDWAELNTFKDGIQFPGYRVPIGPWMRLQFVHDGLTRMQLSVNGAAVTRGVLSGVPGVGPKGIRIGNAIDKDEPFGGDIDEIKIWRTDPNEPRRQFVRRPIDRETADCLARYLQSLNAALLKHPDCAKRLRRDLVAALDRFRRAVAEQGPETRQKFQEFCYRYALLWHAGRIDGGKMRAALADWCAWLKLIGISPEGDEAYHDLFASECWRLIQGELDCFDCDPHLSGFIALMQEGCSGGRTEPKPKSRAEKPKRKSKVKKPKAPLSRKSAV